MASSEEYFVIIFYIPSEHQINVSSKTRILYTDLKKYFTRLTNGEIIRLYVNFGDWLAKVYCKDQQKAEDLKIAVLEENKYNLEFTEMTRERIRMPSSGDKQIAAKVSNQVMNMNGTPVALLSDDQDNQYVSVTQAKETGFNLFNSETDAQRFVISSMQDYLETQAQLYLDMMHLNYRIPHDINISVSFANGYTEHAAFCKSTPGPRAQPQNKQPCSNQQSDNKIAKLTSKSSLSPSTEKTTINNTTEKNNESEMTFVKHVMTPLQLINNINRKNAEKSLVKNVEETSKKLTKLNEYPSISVYVDNMNDGLEVQIHVLKVISESEFIGFVMCKESEDFEHILDNANLDFELLTPCVGDMVIIEQKKNRRSRAIILELLESTFKVAALEFGETLEVDAVFEMPKELNVFEEFVCSCEAQPDVVQTISINDGFMTKTKGANLLQHGVTNTLIKCKRWLPIISSNAFPPELQESPKPTKPEQKIFTAIPSKIPTIKMNEEVMLVGFDKNILHLRSRAMRQLITKMNNELQNVNLERLEKPPICGQYVLHRLENGTEWRRCLIEKILDNNVEIQHIDYTQTNTVVSSSLLFNLPECALFGPTLFQARLNQFEEKEYSRKAQIYMEEALKKKYIVTYLNDDVVDLKFGNSKKCLSKILIDFDLSSFYTLNNLPPFEIELEKEFQMVILHTNDDGTMYFMMSGKEAKSLSEMIEQLNEMKEFQTVEQAIVGQLCISQSEGLWCRGVIENINGNLAKIFYIDFANTELVNFEEIKKYPESCLNVSGCALKGKPSEDSKIRAEFNKAYMATAKRKVNDLYQIRILYEIEA